MKKGFEQLDKILTVTKTNKEDIKVTLEWTDAISIIDIKVKHK